MLVTDRDRAALTWIGDQYAVRTDVIRRLLATDDPLGDPRTRRIVDRWQRAGLVERRRFLAHQPPLVWLTRAGLQLAGHDYRPKWPPVSLLAHIHAVTLVRLGVERQGGRGWVSERALYTTRRTADAHVPDGLFRTPAGTVTAVEVELTLKRADRLRDIVDELTIDYDAVLYVVRDARVGAAVTRAVETLGEEQRVSIVDLASFEADAEF